MKRGGGLVSLSVGLPWAGDGGVKGSSFRVLGNVSGGPSHPTTSAQPGRQELLQLTQEQSPQPRPCTQHRFLPQDTSTGRGFTSSLTALGLAASQAGEKLLTGRQAQSSSIYSAIDLPAVIEVEQNCGLIHSRPFPNCTVYRGLDAETPAVAQALRRGLCCETEAPAEEQARLCCTGCVRTPTSPVSLSSALSAEAVLVLHFGSLVHAPIW